MIYVKCNDGSLKLGGDFNSALAYVKSFPGRKYDWAEKIWRIPADVRTVAMGVPVGGAFYIDEILINPKPQDITELRARLQARLRDLAPEAVAKKIEHLIVEGLFWDAIENGFLQLSPEKRDAVFHLVHWYDEELGAINELLQNEEGDILIEKGRCNDY